MARLIPGRIRLEGIDLYKANQVTWLEGDEQVQRFQVSDLEVLYDTSDRLTSCPCELFSLKGYCQHLAAVEYYFKHHQAQAAEVYKGEELVAQQKEEHLFGSRFLDGLMRQVNPSLNYCLSVTGELTFYEQEIHWTLKIQRLPDTRVYIIRDIPAFLNLVNQGDFYQIGKNYYEQLDVACFDEASQAVLTFLNRLVSSDSSAFFPNNGRHLFLPGGFFEEGMALLGQLSSFFLSLGFEQEMTQPVVKPLTSEANLFQTQVKLEVDHIQVLIKEKALHSFFDQAYLYHNRVFYALSPEQHRLAKAIKSLPIGTDWSRSLTLDVTEQARLAEQLLDFAQLGPVEAPKSFLIRSFSPQFALDLVDGQLSLTLTFSYEDGEVNNQADFDQLPFTSDGRLKTAIDQTLIRLGFAPGFASTRPLPQGADLFEFLENGLAQLRRLGQVSLSPAVEQLWQMERPSIRLEQAGGLLEVSFDFSDLDPADITQALTSLRQQEPYFINRSGQVVVFDDEVKRISQTLLELRAKEGQNQTFQLSRLASLQIKEALSSYDRVSFSAELEEMTKHLATPEAFPLDPLSVSASLRPYQERGVQWLSVLDHYGFGGILADDMGLGKTLQTIAFLSNRLAEGKKALIITPSSLIYNWQEELNKFYPQASVAVVQGSKAQREELIASAPGVTLTSYNSFRHDLASYQEQHYDYLILDEAQALKNSQTKIAQALRDLDVARCFALSGTPIENRLLEIWSIFQIVLPGLFASKNQFNSLSAQSIARMIQPFVLRRKKEEVLPELPAVTEKAYHNEMSQEQKVIYLAQLERMKERLSLTSPADFARNKMEILSGITRLRQICDTPKLFMPYEGESGKLDSLGELLLQLKENGRRALIFSQFTGMLSLVEDQLTALGLASYKLTGATPPKERQAMTQAFNKGSRDAFLMSLKAGGVGLNLTGADTVILIDLWWNPAVEMQAIGRAHRLGQEKAVQVYRLITKGSIEEKILALQESKRHLIRDVLEGDHERSSLTLEDLKEILGISG